MEAGGDAIISDGANRPLIHVIVDATLADAIQRCNVAIRHGADIDQLSYGFTPSVAAVQSGQYDLCLYLLEQGADFSAYMSDELQRLVHIVVSREKRIASLQAGQRVAYQRLVDWLQRMVRTSIKHARIMRDGLKFLKSLGYMPTTGGQKSKHASSAKRKSTPKR